MRKCIRCGDETSKGTKVCPTCLRSWGNMRTIIFDMLEEKYGKLCPQNHDIFIKETKRLEKIWRKDKEKFQEEIGKG